MDEARSSARGIVVLLLLVLTCPATAALEQANDAVVMPAEDAHARLNQAIDAHPGKLSAHARRAIGKGDLREHRLLVRLAHDAQDLPDGVRRLPRSRSGVMRADARALAALLESEDVISIELDQRIVPLEQVPSWSIVRVGAPDAWPVTGGEGVRVAILDSGIGPHPGLHVRGGWNAIAQDERIEDKDGHGTRVASVVAAVSPDAELYSVKVLESGEGTLSDALEGVAWAREQGMDILVMSFALDAHSPALKEELDAAAAQGMLVVAAAGNDGSAQVRYPAGYAAAIAVGASDVHDARAGFSSHGPKIELLAPGVDIPVAHLDGSYGLAHGTSLAAPHVAGIAALVWGARRNLDAAQVRGKLQHDAHDLGDEGWDEGSGFGIARADLSSEDYGLRKEWTDEGEGNGTTITPLASAGHLDLLDDYAVEGTTGDGALWTGGDLRMRLGADIGVPLSSVKADCHDVQGSADNTLEHCWFTSSASRIDCDAMSGLISCAGASACTIGAVGDYHDVLDESVTRNQVQKARYYDVCTGNQAGYLTLGDRVLVMDRKRSACVNATHYVYQGRFAGSSWETYVGPAACAGACDASRALESSSRDVPLMSPCITCAANGTVQVIAHQEGAPMQGLHVQVAGAYEGTTDVLGTLAVPLAGVACDVPQQVQVRCADNVTVCGTRVAQIDIEGDADSLVFDCSLACGSGKDLYVGQSGAWVDVDTKTVTVTLWSRGIARSDVAVNLTRQGEEGTLEESVILHADVAAGQGTNVSHAFSQLGEGDYLHVWADYGDAVEEDDEADNYLFRPALKPVKAYLDVQVDPTFSSANAVIKEYLASFVDEVASPAGADVIISVKAPPEVILGSTRLIAPAGQITRPYGGVVQRSIDAQGTPIVRAYGLGIEGTLAAVKRMMGAREIFLSEDGASATSYIDDSDALGIGIYDRMHSPEAQGHSRDPSSPLFAENVRKMLFDNSFEVAIMPVRTRDTTSYEESTLLRVKHVNSDFSEEYKDAIGLSDTPVVFSGGLFSDLEAWEGDGDGLARQMANEGWDVWEIEMTGGPGTDCEACPNYRYEDLVDHYWPASIAGVVEYSGKDTIHYVGHSNGCRAALSSLDSYSSSGKTGAGYAFDYATGEYVGVDLPARVVDRFVGVACPIALDGESTFTESVREEFFGSLIGVRALSFIPNEHVRMRDFASPVISMLAVKNEVTIGSSLILLSSLLSSERISKNLLEFYIDLSIENPSSVYFSDVDVDKMVIINGAPSDLIVPIEDQYVLNSSAPYVSRNLYVIGNGLFPVPLVNDHSFITKNRAVEETIKSELS